ncbi:MAG: nicotinate-nucleotide adenylyltransferase [Bacilli bacterium]
MSTKRIALFGGTFDPPHLAHLGVARAVWSALGLDYFRFMPNSVPPHKDAQQVSALDRLHMLQLLIENDPQFTIETYEIDHPGRSYTIDTVRALKEKEPNSMFYFLIGADMVEYLPQWHAIDELTQHVHFVGVGRPGYVLKTEYPITFIDAPSMNVSSSMIRNRLRKGDLCTDVLPESVIRYIKERELYGVGNVVE